MKERGLALVMFFLKILEMTQLPMNRLTCLTPTIQMTLIMKVTHLNPITQMTEMMKMPTPHGNRSKRQHDK